ncbi:MAG: methyltransferase domain-containing protein [Clostridiales bacterium]|nr:methyltransferase domain-containing protein [Clostridiales bacterium]
MNDWNSELYLKFKKERTQPSVDLINRITCENPKKIIDIGCGPGNSTNALKNRYPNAYIIGVDNSVNMIEKAESEYPDIDFKLFDASRDFDLIIDKFDIVFSNACIQWIPNHQKLLKNMFNILKSGGSMAVQVPLSRKQPVKKVFSAVSKSDKWNRKLNQISTDIDKNTLLSEEYFDILSDLTDDFYIWETMYFHRMPSHQSIVDWYRATGLKPYLDILKDDEKIEFEKDVLEGIKKICPTQKNGEIIFRFPRLFFIANKL